MNNNKKMYNMVFPLFILRVFRPLSLSTVLLGNFLIDSIVLIIISLIILNKIDFGFYKKKIFRIWGYGLLADSLGAVHIYTIGEIVVRTDPYSKAGLLGNVLIGIAESYDYGNMFYNVYGILFILSGILVSSVAIFLLNYYRSLRDISLSKKRRIISCLTIAVMTAPYTFFLPMS